MGRGDQVKVEGTVRGSGSSSISDNHPHPHHNGTEVEQEEEEESGGGIQQGLSHSLDLMSVYAGYGEKGEASGGGMGTGAGEQVREGKGHEEEYLCRDGSETEPLLTTLKGPNEGVHDGFQVRVREMLSYIPEGRAHLYIHIHTHKTSHRP